MSTGSTTAISVLSAAQLKTALDTATGGETILLAAGDYGVLDLQNKFAGEVTIVVNTQVLTAGDFVA